jgi:O-antigen biosynthesis protein
MAKRAYRTAKAFTEGFPRNLEGAFFQSAEKLLRLFPKHVKNKALGPGQPLLSVVIPCYNLGNYIEDAIKSLLAQTFQDFEILVIDGGSDDEETRRVVSSLKVPRCQVFLREGRHLAGDNRNFGIQIAKGRYICCLDADDLLQPAYFKEAVSLLEIKNLDVVYPSVQCFGQEETLWGARQAEFYDNIETTNAVATVAIFRKTCWEECGGFKDWGVKDKHVFEDWEFWTRLLGYGCRFRPIAEPLMLHRVREESLSRSATLPYEQQRRIISEQCDYLRKGYFWRRLRTVRPFKVRDAEINLCRAGEREVSGASP